MPKKTILIVYEYFFPGYKAGGPIQSLVNMVIALQDQYEFKVMTTAFDLNEIQPYSNIQTNTWISIQLAPHTPPIQVWYTATTNIQLSTFKKVVQQSHASLVYINGLFTPWFMQLLLLKKSIQLRGVELVICPRGMLQAGALSVKPFKKKIFLSVFKNVLLFRGVRWHATNEEEAADIKKNIHGRAHSVVAYNIPKPTVATIKPCNKQVGKLSLVYLSLITQKKNLLLLLNILSTCKATIELAIFGPIKDKLYWQSCEALILQMPSNITIQYKGDVQPFDVQDTIAKYDAFVLLTKGENFGHALFEALSCGRPLITSYFTPWNELQTKQAGWNVDIQNATNIAVLFNQLAELNSAEWNYYCTNAYVLANEYYAQLNLKQSYSALFN